MAGEFALEVEGLSKVFRIYPSAIKRVGEALTLGRYQGHHDFWALRGIDLKLKAGGALGLCGANGAGKSTLLKILAGTTTPSEGRFRVRGRVASLLELGAGFHMDFTGRANIYVNGIMMGLSKREVEGRIDEIISFAELGDYIDEPVRTYSSGMGMRLAFSVAMAVDPDVMIIDEVFAVGDMYFQKKCVDKIYEFRKRGKTILFCSHSLYDVRQLCDEALWLRDGEPAAIGDSVEVTNAYTSFQRHHIDESKDLLEDQFPAASVGGGARALPRILDARFYRMSSSGDLSWDEAYEVTTGDSIELRVWWENPDPEGMPIHLGVGFLRQDMTTCAGMGTHLDGVRLEGRSGCASLRIPELQLLSGQFLVPVLLLDEGGVYKYQEFLLPENLVVRTDTREVGLVRLAHEWQMRGDLPRPGPPAPGGAPSQAGDGVA